MRQYKYLTKQAVRRILCALKKRSSRCDQRAVFLPRRTRKELITMAVAYVALADLSLSSLIWWLVVGLIAGALAGLVMRGGGYGIVGDIIVGIRRNRPAPSGVRY